MNYFISFCLLIITFSCNSIKIGDKDNIDYFEGEIIYNIVYSNIIIDVSSDYLEENIGSKVILTFKNGNHRKEYYSKSGKLLSVRILDLDKKKSFSKSTGENTVDWIDITKQDTKLTFKRIKDSTIIGYSSIGIEAIGSTVVNEENISLTGTFFYAKELNVNPEWYKDYKEANFNEIIKIGKGLSVSEVSNTPYWVSTLNAVEVKRRKVSDSELKINLSGCKLIEL